MNKWRYILPCGHHLIKRISNKENKRSNLSEYTHYKCESKQCDKIFEFKLDKKRKTALDINGNKVRNAEKEVKKAMRKNKESQYGTLK